MKFYNYLFILIFLLFSNQLLAEIESTVSKDIDETLEEFKGTRFLNFDKIYIPNELKVIEEQISQNAIDVIILSGTHSIVYNTQYDPKGHSKTYQNFYGLKIEIQPIANKDSFYSLRLFYYNWITKKYDKKQIKEISKYNVLNELRFALYRMFKGNSFVEKNIDNIEKSNYDRIQAVAKSIEQNQAKTKKKLKEAKDKTENITITPPEKLKENEQLLKREEDKKKLPPTNLTSQEEAQKSPMLPTENNDSSKTEENILEIDKIKIKKDDNVKNDILKKKNETPKVNTTETEESTLPPELKNSQSNESTSSSESIPRKSDLSIQVGYSSDSIETIGLLKTKTNIRYAALGANFSSTQKIEKPLGFKISMFAGIPLNKDNYQLPILREIHTELFKKNLIPRIKLGTGIDYSPVSYVNLPEQGKGLNVFTTDIIWVKFCLAITIEFYDKMIELEGITLTSLSTKTNFETKLSASKMIGNIKLKINENHGFNFNLQKTSLTGEISGNSQGISMSYSYFFGG